MKNLGRTRRHAGGSLERAKEALASRSSDRPTWVVGDRVRLYTRVQPEHGKLGTITEIHRRSIGSLRFTVKVDDHGEVYVSEGSLRRAS